MQRGGRSQRTRRPPTHPTRLPLRSPAPEAPRLRRPTAFERHDGAVEALVTLLAVVVFGLGWATVEGDLAQERGGARSTGYAEPTRAAEPELSEWTEWTLAAAEPYEAREGYRGYAGYTGYASGASAGAAGDEARRRLRAPAGSGEETRQWTDPVRHRSKP